MTFDEIHDGNDDRNVEDSRAMIKLIMVETLTGLLRKWLFEYSEGNAILGRPRQRAR